MKSQVYNHQFLLSPGRLIAIFLLLLSMTLFQGCKFYYKVQTINKVTMQKIKKYDSLNKYLILHQADSAWHLSDPGYNDNMVYGKLCNLPDDHLKYLTTSSDPEEGNRYKKNKKNDESAVLTEVHLYLKLKDTLVPKFAAGDSVRITYSAIQKADEYNKNKARTLASWLMPGIGVPLLIGGIVAILYVVAINNINISAF
jgi:hypothetical protein